MDIVLHLMPMEQLSHDPQEAHRLLFPPYFAWPVSPLLGTGCYGARSAAAISAANANGNGQAVGQALVQTQSVSQCLTSSNPSDGSGGGGGTIASALAQAIASIGGSGR